MAADVDDEQPRMLVVEREDVEEVAGEALAGHVPPGDGRAAGISTSSAGRSDRCTFAAALRSRTMWALIREISVVERRRVPRSTSAARRGRPRDPGWRPQFLVLGDGVLERGDEEVEHLLAAGLTRNFCPASVTSSIAAEASSADSSGDAEQRLHAAQQVVGLVGLGDVVVGAGVEAADDVDRVGERRQQDEGAPFAGPDRSSPPCRTRSPSSPASRCRRR